MNEADEGIVLTDREREALAGLAAAIGDPWLAGQLTGSEQLPPPEPRRPRRLPAAVSALGAWVGVLLVVAGGLLAVLTFMHSTPVAVFGLVVMGAGIWRLATRTPAVVRRWLRLPSAAA